MITDWNTTIAGHAAEAQSSTPLVTETRIFALVHRAMAEALDAAERSGADGIRADADIAAAYAAHDVLAALLPTIVARFDAQLASDLDRSSDRAAVAAGASIGRSTAERVLDGWGTITSGGSMADSAATCVRLLTIPNTRRHRPDAPEDLPILRFRLGQSVSGTGVIDDNNTALDCETAAAMFWGTSPVVAWNTIARALAARHQLSHWDQARLFSMLNSAMADAVVASRDAQKFFAQSGLARLMRPALTRTRPLAVALGGGRSGAMTLVLQHTSDNVILASVPDYPAASSSIGGAAETVLAWFFGGDVHELMFESPRAPSRRFTRLSDAAREQALAPAFAHRSRRDACVAGYETGRSVGHWIVKYVGKTNRRRD